MELAPEPPQITEASVAAVMRLANRMKDLRDVVGLWKDLQEACDRQDDGCGEPGFVHGHEDRKSRPSKDASNA